MKVFFLVVPLLSVSGNVFLVFCSACYSRFFSKAGHRTNLSLLHVLLPFERFFTT